MRAVIGVSLGIAVAFATTLALAQSVVSTLEPARFTDSVLDHVPVAGQVVRGLWLLPAPPKVGHRWHVVLDGRSDRDR